MIEKLTLLLGTLAAVQLAGCTSGPDHQRFGSETHASARASSTRLEEPIELGAGDGIGELVYLEYRSHQRLAARRAEPVKVTAAGSTTSP